MRETSTVFLIMAGNTNNPTNQNSEIWWTAADVVDELQRFVDEASSPEEFIQQLLNVKALPGISKPELSVVYCEYGTQNYKLIIHAGEAVKEGVTPTGVFDPGNQAIRDVATKSLNREEYPWFKTKNECKEANFDGFGTVMLVPMYLGRDRRLGAFIIHRKEENAYDKSLQRIMDALSDRLAAMIRSLRRRLRDELAYGLRNELLGKIASSKQMFASECEILTRVLAHLHEWYEMDRIHILMKNPLDVDTYYEATYYDAKDNELKIRLNFRTTEVLDQAALYKIIGGEDNLKKMTVTATNASEGKSIASHGGRRNPADLPDIADDCKSWLGVTMHHPDGHVFGHIVLHDTEMPSAYDKDDVRFMDAIADFTGFLLADFRTKQKKAIIQELLTQPLTEQLQQQLCAMVAAYLRQFYGAEKLQILAKDRSSQEWRAIWVTNNLALPIEEAVQTAVVKYTNKERNKTDYWDDPLEFKHDGQNYLVTPVRSSQTKDDWSVIGAFIIPANNPGKLASYVIDEVSDALGSRLNSLHNQRRYKALTSFVNKVSSLASTSLTQEKVLQIAHQYISKVMFSENVYIALYDEVDDTISFPLIYRNGKVWEEMFNQTRKIDPTQLGRTEVIIRDQKPLFIKTKAESLAWYEQPNHKEHAGNPLASWVGVPIFIASEGERQKIRGVIAAYHDELDYVYSTRDMFFLQNVAGAVSGLFRAFELKKANDIILNYESQLQKNLNARDISHRMKGGLSSISIKSRKLINENFDSEKIKMGLEQINETANLLLRSASEMAHISKSEVKVVPFIKEIIQQISSEFRESNIVIKTDEKDIRSFQDKRSLFHIIHSLLTNACEATRDKKDAIINVFLEENENRFQLIIKDNGIPIPEKDEENIFQLGFSTKEDGQGYALWRAKNYAQQNKGDLIFFRERKFKCFKLTLPSIIKQPIAIIVDDQKIWREILCEWLSKIGYQTVTASNIQDAELLLNQGEKPDLITIDIGLDPEGIQNREGLRLISFARKMYNSSVKLIIVSSFTESSSRYKSEVDFIFGKSSKDGAPLDEKTFLRIIEAL